MPGVRPAGRLPVQLRAVPPLDPPFDDESTAAAGPGRGQLALDLTGAGRPVISSRPRGGSHPAHRRPAAPLDPLPLPNGMVPTATPEARQAARRFLRTCLEILNGYRPISHLRPLTSPGESEGVIGQFAVGLDRLAVLARRAGGRRELVQIRRVRVCEPRPGAAEAAAVLGNGGRTWAVAFRLERRRGSWVATALCVV